MPVAQVEREKSVDYAPMQIARVICVAPIEVAELSKRLLEGNPLSNIIFTEALLIRKSDRSEPSAGQVMPIGGQVGEEVVEGETRFKGGLREVGEETSLLSLSDREDSHRIHHPSFVFQIPGRVRPRDVEFFVHPVHSSSVFPQVPREGFNGGEDKISEVISFSPGELEQLIREGFVERHEDTIQAAGHFTKIDDPTIEILEEDKQRKNAALDGIIDEVNGFETTIRTATLESINRLRTKFKGQDPLEGLEEATHDEIVTGFVAAQMRMALSDERTREKSDEPDSLPAKADLLKVLPYLAALPASALPDLLLMVPTQEIVNGLRCLEQGFNSGVEVIIERLVSDPSEREQLRRMGYIDALKTLWPQFPELDFADSTAIMDEAEEATRAGFSDNTDSEYSAVDVSHALNTAMQFNDFITAEIQSRREEEFDLFQEHRPMNEILNAGLFTHMVYAFGLHPHLQIDPDTQEGLQTLRFEAMRNLAVFGVALEATKKIREAKNTLIQGAMDTYFEFPPTKEVIDLGQNRFHNIYHRIDRATGMHIITDERTIKTRESTTRKMFQGNPLELLDIFSINFVLADDNFRDSADPIGDRLSTAETFKNYFIEHLRAKLSEGDTQGVSRVEIVEGTYKAKSLENVKEIQAGDTREREYQGLRAGSKGDAIIREKFVLRVTDKNGVTQHCEIVIFPFQSSSVQGVSQLGEAGMWGFVEKFNDDYQGNYKARRILAREIKHPTKHSTYELLYPGHLYEKLSSRMRGRHIRSVQSRRRNARSSSEDK